MKKMEIIDIRVTGRLERLPQIIERIISQCASDDFQLVKRSEPYPNRPPNDQHGRVYLSFVMTQNDGKE